MIFQSRELRPRLLVPLAILVAGFGLESNRASLSLDMLVPRWNWGHSLGPTWLYAIALYCR